jgi:hypothetical protein
MKWVGGLTAILSLVFAIQKAVQLVSDTRERQRQITELTAVATLQQNSGDYRASWATYQKAIDAAEPTGQLAKLTGQLSERRQQLREAQEDLAMVWIQNLQVRSGSGESFSDLIGPLDPVINRGIASSSGVRKADLLAHAGWATFLKWRDGQRGLDPNPQYAQALEADPGNPYANAYRAHWLFWTKGDAAMTEARANFAAALASGRVRDHIRGIQLAALRNLGSAGEPEFLAVINDMRQKGEPIELETRIDIYNRAYAFACGLQDAPEQLTRLTASVPIAEQLATFQALFYGADSRGPDDNPRPSADACLATLFEAAGQREPALNVWTALSEKFPPRSGHRLGDRARAAIKRLH